MVLKREDELEPSIFVVKVPVNQLIISWNTDEMGEMLLN